MQPVCSPSRATLLTGRHVIHTGVYHAFGNDASGDLSLNFTLLPQHLRGMGYQTHGVGKVQPANAQSAPSHLNTQHPLGVGALCQNM